MSKSVKGDLMLFIIICGVLWGFVTVVTYNRERDYSYVSGHWYPIQRVEIICDDTNHNFYVMKHTSSYGEYRMDVVTKKPFTINLNSCIYNEMINFESYGWIKDTTDLDMYSQEQRENLIIGSLDLYKER